MSKGFLQFPQIQHRKTTNVGELRRCTIANRGIGQIERVDTPGFRQPLHLHVWLATAHASSASASAGRPVVARADAELLVRRDSPRRSGSTNGRTPTGTGATVRA